MTSTETVVIWYVDDEKKWWCHLVEHQLYASGDTKVEALLNLCDAINYQEKNPE
jgi:hypothetical protein